MPDNETCVDCRAGISRIDGDVYDCEWCDAILCVECYEDQHADGGDGDCSDDDDDDDD